MKLVVITAEGGGEYIALGMPNKDFVAVLDHPTKGSEFKFDSIEEILECTSVSYTEDVRLYGRYHAELYMFGKAIHNDVCVGFEAFWVDFKKKLLTYVDGDVRRGKAIC